MVKLPKDAGRIIKILMDKGFQAYAVGGCVRDSLLGLHPYDWDITTSAGLEELKKLFPEAKIISEKYSVVRLENIRELCDEDGNFTGEAGTIIDIATFRKDGVYSDGRRPDEVVFVSSIEEDLPRRDFTMNAIADNGYQVVDTFGGIADIRQKLIRTIGKADERFQEDPIRMMRAVRFAAELGFDLHKDVYEAILANRELLERVSTDRLRTEFVRLMAAPHAGKGLSMVVDTGIINLILGDEIVASLTRREKSDLSVLCRNIDRSQQVPERRLGLLYTCMSRKKAEAAIERMNYDKETRQHLMDAAKDMPKLYFTCQPHELKKFIYERGWDRYNYLASLEKAQRIVFDYFSDTKIKSKMFMVDEIKRKQEAIFVEDLAIDGSDLKDAGICEGEEIGKMLHMLTESVHIRPADNNRKALLALARKYKRNKLAAMTRNIKWLR